MSGGCSRTLSEHIYTPVRLPLSHIDVFVTVIAPILTIPRSQVIHMKTMHAFTTPEALDRWSVPTAG